MDELDYDKYEPDEHVRERPDTYIGDIEVITEPRWIYKESENRMVKKQVTYNPGLEQCVMELITNATDRAQNPDNKVTKISLSINEDTVTISNDGVGIRIELHEKHNIYIPELVFGNMLSSSNFKKGVKKTVGGKNGIGAKAANIFSTKFVVTIVYNGQKYVQTFTDQMRNKTKPKITKVKAKDSVTIDYTPALEVFGMKKLDENDTPALIRKRIIDASAVTNKNVVVTFNGEKVSTKSFEDYINLYIGNKTESPRVFVESDRWTVGFALNPYPNATQISFVNGICTEDGGSHVTHVLEPVLNRVVKELSEKHKELTIRKTYIKDNIIIFVKSLIENPTFDSQTKRHHTSRPMNFGSKLILSDDTIKKIIKLGITKGIMEIAKAKDLKGLKKIDGKKVSRIIHIDKLDDANYAGGEHSHKCTLILTEGDSAKATALAGISVVGKDHYGVFPLKGKLLNVRDASAQKIGKNEEIININKILGLSKDEKDVSNLRYGKVMVMTDQDSVTGDTPLLLKKDGKIVIKNIEDMYTDPFEFENMVTAKEYSKSDYEVWSEIGWTKIKHVMRHKTTKEIFRVMTHTGCVDVTEDHSLLDDKGEKIKPTECKVGTELLHSFPILEENRINIPDNLESLNVTDLRKYAFQIKLRSYKTSTKPEIIKLLCKYKNQKPEILNNTENYYSDKETEFNKTKQEKIDVIPDNLSKLPNPQISKLAVKLGLNIKNVKHVIKKDFISKINEYKSVLEADELDIDKLNIVEKNCIFKRVNDTLSITPEEAWVTGFFMADGNCGIGKDKQKTVTASLKPPQRGWCISNCDLSLLEKSKKILTKIYGDEFKIYEVPLREDSYGVNDKYRLSLLKTRTKNKYIVEKYRKLCYYKDWKYIHQNILNSNKEIRQQVYDGYYAGDGRHDLTVSNVIDINGKITTQCLYYLAKSLGKVVSINHLERKDKVYTLCVGIRYNRDPIKIKKIFRLGRQNDYVYDLETENHHFQGGIGEVVLHNSDGFHIKGLVVNYLACFCPKLLSNNFVYSLLTPIIKVFKSTNVKNFYNIQDYETWKRETTGSSSWRVKYYKGLGTSSAAEAKEYFRDLKNNKVGYTYDNSVDSEDYVNLELAFSESKKTNTDKRKEWISETMKLIDEQKKTGKLIVDYNEKTVSVKTFVKGELALHSLYDNQRSIPHFCDGLKPSQRKILYSALKRNLYRKSDGSGEIKVAQFSGYVSEHSGYHHGEVSLQGAIINMAQDYVGSNNMNIMFPSGQFGTRQKGGKDASSSRYIFTHLNKWVKNVFNENDNKLLNYLEDDGVMIEPEYYVPNIPMLLVNGSDGIGTGWSTTIPQYNPKDIINNLKRLIKDEENEIVQMDPWYRGFTGTIVKKDTHTWEVTGVLQRMKPSSSYQDIEVTELPIGLWTQDFKAHLSVLEQSDTIVNYKDNSDDTKIKFRIRFRKLYLSKTNDYDIYKLLKMTKNIKDSNMHAFQCDGSVKKYECAEEILWDFFQLKKSFYTKRKNYMENSLESSLEKLNEKMRFIQMVMNSELIVFRRRKTQIVEDLEKLNFKKIASNSTSPNFDYLINISLSSFTEEKLLELQKQIDKNSQELFTLKSKSCNDLWMEDLELDMEPDSKE